MQRLRAQSLSCKLPPLVGHTKAVITCSACSLCHAFREVIGGGCVKLSICACRVHPICMVCIMCDSRPRGRFRAKAFFLLLHAWRMHLCTWEVLALGMWWHSFWHSQKLGLWKHVKTFVMALQKEAFVLWLSGLLTYTAVLLKRVFVFLSERHFMFIQNTTHKTGRKGSDERHFWVTSWGGSRFLRSSTGLV